jgi:hypothetical protein
MRNQGRLLWFRDDTVKKQKRRSDLRAYGGRCTTNRSVEIQAPLQPDQRYLLIASTNVPSSRFQPLRTAGPSPTKKATIETFHRRTPDGIGKISIVALLISVTLQKPADGSGYS